MDNNPIENKVLGIQVKNYLKVCYGLVLIGAGFGAISHLLALGGLYIGGGLIAGLLGLLGIALAATGWQAFPEKFTALEISHFRYLIILFVSFFALMMILGGIFGAIGAVGQFLIFFVALFQLLCVYVGFDVWKSGEEASKDNLINGFNSLKAKVTKT